MKFMLAYWPALLAASSFFELAFAQRTRKNGNGAAAGGATTGSANTNAASGTADGTAKITRATDGSMIMDMTVNINNLPIRFKVSAPASQFLASTGMAGANATEVSAANTTMGINVLLHGDGGQSFFDFPNQAVQKNLMGVVALAPDPNLFWGGGSGLQRTDGVAHSAALNSLVQDVLPQVVAFDKTKAFFTGVSGGSLMLSGFFVPAHMANYKTGVELNCGGLAPQVEFVDAANVLSTTRIHFQSTKGELAMLQTSIPQSIQAYQQLATQSGVDSAALDQLQTADNTPNGGHCAFDGKAFVSGVQLMATNYANVMLAGGNGQVTGIGNVAKSASTARLTFTQPRRQKKRRDIENLGQEKEQGQIIRPRMKWVIDTNNDGAASKAVAFKA